MKGKKWKRTLSFLLGLAVMEVFLSSMSGCGSVPLAPDGELEKTNEEEQGQKSGADGSVKIWGTLSTSTVFQDAAIENRSNPTEQQAELNIRMAKGETEGGQLILTPSRDVSSYGLEVSDLVNGEERITTDRIKAYKQAYIYAESAAYACQGLPATKYPDMLLPLEIAAAYGENRIAAGDNQGITVEVTTDSETAPGTYRGTFVLDIDGEKTEIPVTVTVWDIDITESHLRNIDMAMYDTMQRGGQASTAEIRNYYEDLLDYRMQITYMPFSTSSPERFREELLRYYDDPRVNSIGLPDAFGIFEQCLLEAARLSTPDKLYTDKLICYDKNRDESESTDPVIEAAQKYRQAKENVIAALETEGFFDQPGYGGTGGDFHKRLTGSIRGVKLVYTCGYNNLFEGHGITYCINGPGGSAANLPVSASNVYWSNSQFAAYKDYYDQSGEWFMYANGGGVEVGHSRQAWNSNQRYLGYILYDMGTAGELTWGTSLYSRLSSSADIQLQPRNWYEDGYTFPSLDFYMDGCLIYPGTMYGLDTFLPSLRLTNRRDGFEDYELIYRLAEVYDDTLKNAYGSDYDMNDTLDWIFKKAIDNRQYCMDEDTLLFEMRETVVALIELAEADCELVFSGITFDKEQANLGTMEFFVKDGYEVSVDSTVLHGTPAGGRVKYQVTRDANSNNDFCIVMAKNGENYTFNARMVRSEIHMGANGEDGALKEAFTSSAKSQSLAGEAARFLFEGAEIEDSAEILALTKNDVRINKSYFECDLDELYCVTMTVEAETTEADKDTDLLLEIFLAADSGSRAEIEIVNLKANGTTKRELTFTFLIDKMTGEYYNDYDALQFELSRYYDNSVFQTDYYTDTTGKYEGDRLYHIYGDITLDMKHISWMKYDRSGGE